MPKLSIIVPVYNIERYLKRCIISILSQSYQDFELILVDDGSSDTSGDICEKYASMDARITVVHQKNSGQSIARNTGLDIARGEYIGFVDSDDWISTDMYDHLVYLLEKYDCDIAETGYKIVNREIPTSPTTNKAYKIQILSDRIALLKRYLTKGLRKRFGGYSVCIKLYRSSMFLGIRFDNTCSCEDYLINFQLLSKAKRVVYSNKRTYFYFQRPESTIHGKLNENDFSMLINCSKVCELAKEYDNSAVCNLSDIKVLRCYFSLLAKAYLYGVSPEIQKEDIERVKHLFNRSYWKLLLSPISISRKLLMTAILINNYTNMYKINYEDRNKSKEKV